MLSKRALPLLLSLVILAAAFAASASPSAAESAQITVATFSSPALGTDVGKALDLSACQVQFSEKEGAVDGSKITWKLDGSAIASYTPSAAGVVKLEAEYGSHKRTVYAVAKDPSDTAYTLHEDGFSAFEASAYRTVQKTTGATVTHDAVKGALILNASNSGDAYIRLLLPSWLDVFGDAIVDADLFLSDPNGASSRWGSVMYRVQNANYPYMQTALRYDSSLSNGAEIAHRTEANAWDVVVKGPATASNSSYNRISVSFAGTESNYSIDGKTVLTYSNTLYRAGGIGLQVRGLTMTVDRIAVYLNPASEVIDDSIPGGYAELSLPETNISLGPVLSTRPASVEDISAPYANPATSVILPLTYEGGRLSVKLKKNETETALTVGEVFEVLGGKKIPVFETDSSSAAAALAAELKSSDKRDAFIMSSDRSVIRTAVDGWKYIYGIYRATAGTKESVRQETTSCGARIVILPEELLTRENVDFLQDRYIEVWAETGASDPETVSVANRGACGIITPDPAAAASAMSKYYDKYTLTRYPNIIGHRGIPSQAQENSLAGSVLATSLGACMVENDIYLVRDGVLMVMHDSTIDRTTNGTGSITAMTSKQLAQYTIQTVAGIDPEPIPALEDYLKEFKGSGKTIVIEIKENNSNMVKTLAELIKKYDMKEEVVVISFHDTPLAALRNELADIPEAWLNSSIKPSEENVYGILPSIMDKVQPLSAVYSPSYASGALGTKLTGALFARGVTTWIWTVNKAADFDSYFGAGTRGITTNYSDWCSSLVKKLEAEYDKETGICRIFAETYKGDRTDVTGKVKMVTVGKTGGDISFTSKDGSFGGDFASADVFFKLKCTTGHGKTYWKVTELLTLTPAGQTPSDSSEALSSDTGAPEAGTAGPGTGSETATGTETGETPSGGCRSLAGGAAIVIAAVCCSYALIRRKD